MEQVSPDMSNSLPPRSVKKVIQICIGSRLVDIMAPSLLLVALSAACAVHGADKLALGVGKDVLVLGAGPTGMLFGIWVLEFLTRNRPHPRTTPQT